MKISIIAAIGKNNEIGQDNKLLWKSPSDLALFKKITLGKPIIMGRKTFESLPGILPNRRHIVISSVGIYNTGNDSVKIAGSLEIALEMCASNAEVFIIGGASIYEQALPLADELHITHMDWEGQADTYFPKIDRRTWKIHGVIPNKDDSVLPWVHYTYKRRDHSQQ